MIMKKKVTVSHQFKTIISNHKEDFAVIVTRPNRSNLIIMEIIMIMKKKVTVSHQFKTIISNHKEDLAVIVTRPNRSNLIIMEMKKVRIIYFNLIIVHHLARK